MGARLKGQALDYLRSLSASVMLTMRVFDVLPEPDLRPRTAIVRQMSPIDRFDPRELLPNGIVLTLPFTLDTRGPQSPVGGGFWLN